MLDKAWDSFAQRLKNKNTENIVDLFTLVTRHKKAGKFKPVHFE